jgi:hypothetical protein
MGREKTQSMHSHLIKKIGSFFIVLVLCIPMAFPLANDGNLEKKNGLASTDSTAVVDVNTHDGRYDDESEITEPTSRSSYNVIFYLLYRFITNNPLTKKH